jgi:hypothetical protein
VVSVDHATSIRREIEDAHTVVLSFPKAGRSWLCYFLARYVAARTGERFDLDLVTTGRELPHVRFTHEHIDVFGDTVAPPRLLDESLLMRRRIVVLVRDPRDSLVSYWHQKRLRERRPVPPALELFADSPVYGIERVSRATSLLLDLHDAHPGDKLLVTYEALVADPARRLTEVLRFALDGRPLDRRCLDAALEASRFERMRSWERSLGAREARLVSANRFGGSGGDAAFKVRRGEPGAFATEMSPALQRHVARLPHTAALLRRLAALAA